jgi:hypothetical protein
MWKLGLWFHNREIMHQPENSDYRRLLFIR